MSRYLGTAAGRTLGATGTQTFTKAKVFSGTGTTSFTVPADVSKLKVYVVGAGSSYRSGTYCFNGAACCSGVAYPRNCYSACFLGHLTGAGGGYAEKTFIQSTDLIAGKTLTINVGSIGGLSASSVSATGITTVTASNATEAAYSWSCTNNSTARDNSNDNPISIGIQLPVCGYQNSFSGYYNRGGTASGGDINRTGGRGVLIPEFLYNSYFDGITNTSYSASVSGNTSSCWINPTITTASLIGYHTVFGANPNFNATNCFCYCLCTGITNLCSNNTLSGLSSRYTFVGRNTKDSSYCYYGSENTNTSTPNCAYDAFIKDVPSGIGAQSGNSASNGVNGNSELVVTQTTITDPSATGPEITVTCNFTTSGYDFSFGGTAYSCYCYSYTPGCLSATGKKSSSSAGPTYCYNCIGFAFTYVYGTNNSGTALCLAMPYGNVSGGTFGACSNRTYNMGFSNDLSIANKTTEYQIPLSMLVSDTDTNVSDISYGQGAGISTSASFGGGGNRLYPQGGNGLVVLVY